MMREADFRQLVETAQGRAAYVPAYMVGKDELEGYVKSGMLKSSNRLAKNVKCPCGGAHVSDVFARETPDGLRYFAACDAYARMENYPVDVESLRLYKINPRMVPVEKADRANAVVEIKSHVTAEADRVIGAMKGAPKTREDVIAFVRSLYDKTNPKLSSWPKVVGYVRTLKDKDDPNFAECAHVRALVQGFAKKAKYGIESAWRSIAQEAKPSHGRQRKKANAVPGPVPILYKGSDFL